MPLLERFGFQDAIGYFLEPPFVVGGGLGPEGFDDFCSLPCSIDSGIVIQGYSRYIGIRMSLKV
jgi:hypothetical protein